MNKSDEPQWFKMPTIEEMEKMWEIKYVRCVEAYGTKWIEIRDDAEKPWDNVFIYDIEIGRIKDEQGILSWMRHLSDKMWVSKEILKEFMDVCSHELNINLIISR